VLGRLDLGSVWDTLRAANPPFVLAMLGATASDLTFRAIRWRGLLAPFRRVALPRVLAYLLVGYLANNVLPARLGELVRSHVVGDREGLSRATVLGTIVVERIVDTTVLVAIVSAAILILHVRGLVANAALLGVAVTGLLLLALALALVAHRLPYGDRISDGLQRWPVARSLLVRLGSGLAVARQPRIMGPTIAWSGLAWAATIVGFAAAGRAIGVELTWSQAALLGSGVALSTIIPAGPGSFGTFELAGVQIAAVFGIPPNAAFAMTLLAHASSLVLTSFGGAVALLGLGSGDRSSEVDQSPV
jgi:glycosyltransferase 2 family protein